MSTNKRTRSRNLFNLHFIWIKHIFSFRIANPNSIDENFSLIVKNPNHDSYCGNH